MIYTIPDYQNKENQKEKERLESLGYAFQVNSDGYRVEFKGKFLSGAGVQLPRKSTSRRTYEHKIADSRNYLDSAVKVAQRHETTA